MPGRPIEARFLGSERLKFQQKVQRAMRLEGERVCQLRVKSGMSQRQVASAMGISAAYLCDLEKGHRAMNPALALRHAEALRQLTAERVA